MLLTPPMAAWWPRSPWEARTDLSPRRADPVPAPHPCARHPLHLRPTPLHSLPLCPAPLHPCTPHRCAHPAGSAVVPVLDGGGGAHLVRGASQPDGRHRVLGVCVPCWQGRGRPGPAGPCDHRWVGWSRAGAGGYPIHSLPGASRQQGWCRGWPGLSPPAVGPRPGRWASLTLGVLF